jgi:hypothetical protein
LLQSGIYSYFLPQQGTRPGFFRDDKSQKKGAGMLYLLCVIFVPIENTLCIFFFNPRLSVQIQLVTMIGHVQNVATSISHLELFAT